ncbi:MAG: hypothetical protein WBO73_02585 [Gammaproteobacteria bacterium]|jgi:hypothetical protein
MKYIFSSLVTTFAVGVLAIAPTTHASTPDGQTPAEETICDPLKADGISKGLYGLCVAFCEAQDFAEATIPTTEAELQSLEANAPSGRILANYNKRKLASDPPMPCIVVEPPCPCFTAEQLSAIDGTLMLGDGSSVDIGISCPTNNPASVIAAEPSDLNPDYLRFINVNLGGTCQHIDNQSSPKVNTVLSTTTTPPTITNDELDACRDMLQAHIAVTCP